MGGYFPIHLVMLVFSSVAYSRLSQPQMLGYLQDCDNYMDKTLINDVYYIRITHIICLCVISIRAISSETRFEKFIGFIKEFSRAV